MTRPRQMPAGQTAQVQLRRISTPHRGVNWKLAPLGLIRSLAECTAKNSLGTCDSLLLSGRARGQAKGANPKFSPNRGSDRHSLNSKHEQVRINSGAVRSLHLFPDIRVSKLIAGEVVRPAEVVFEHEARPTRAFQSLRFEICGELILRIWRDGNELTNANVFNSVTIKNDGQRTVPGVRFCRVQGE